MDSECDEESISILEFDNKVENNKDTIRHDNVAWENIGFEVRNGQSVRRIYSLGSLNSNLRDIMHTCSVFMAHKSTISFPIDRLSDEFILKLFRLGEKATKMIDKVPGWRILAPLKDVKTIEIFLDEYAYISQEFKIREELKKRRGMRRSAEIMISARCECSDHLIFGKFHITRTCWMHNIRKSLPR